jgi:hypothetical protein
MRVTIEMVMTEAGMMDMGKKYKIEEEKPKGIFTSSIGHLDIRKKPRGIVAYTFDEVERRSDIEARLGSLITIENDREPMIDSQSVN